MQLLVSLAALLGLELETMKDRFKRAFAGNAIVIVFAAIGLVFLLVAGYLSLSLAVGAINAALAFAAIFLLIALAVHLSLKAQAARERRVAAEKHRSGEAGAFVTTAALTALPALLRSPMVRNLGLPAAAIAALLLLRGGKHD
jgi:choline-glycine betaine transporter